MRGPRIATLLPSATEIVCALGLRGNLVGISHGCDFPPGLDGLSVLTRTSVPVRADSEAIDRHVRRRLGAGDSLYTLDLDALRALEPDLVVSQRLCDVCAVSIEDVESSVASLPSRPQLVDLNPGRFADVLADICRVGQAAGVPGRADRLTRRLQARVDAVRARTSLTPQLRRPRVLVLEWLFPPMTAGHWTPELVGWAGGTDCLGTPGEPSRTVGWDALLAAQPDVLVLALCGFSPARARADLGRLAGTPEGKALLAQVGNRVIVTDGNAYLPRPGPRLVDALEKLSCALLSTGPLARPNPVTDRADAPTSACRPRPPSR